MWLKPNQVGWLHCLKPATTPKAVRWLNHEERISEQLFGYGIAFSTNASF